MKRTNFVTNLVTLFIFAALLIYVGYNLVRSITGDLRTAPAIYVDLTDSAPVTGMLLRDETLISSGEQYINITAENAQLVGAGETLAVAFSSEEALQRAGRIRELELQQKYIISALSENAGAHEASRRDSSIKNAITDLGAAVARHSSDEISSASITLSSLVLDDPGISATEVDLSLVSSELDSLRHSSVSDTVSIKASSPGLFFASTDGFEYLNYQRVADIAPQELRELMDSPQDTPDFVVGKLADPLEWYYAALISVEAADRLTVGSRASLDFGRYWSEPLTGTVWSIHRGVDEAAVVFRFTSGAADMLSVRTADAELVFGSIKGIRVPSEAVYEETGDENGNYPEGPRYYVYTVTGLQAEKKYVTMIQDNEDYCLVMPENVNDSASLREGNDVIITDREIYDGMILE